MIKGSVACLATHCPKFLSERSSVERRVDGQKLMIGIDQGWRKGDRVGVFAKVER